MRLTGSRAYYRSTPPKMPPGLVELIEGLTKEVLKNNPSDIYGFCAGHVQQLLEIRDGPINKKTLTLEEKIVRAQEKIRQRAEKRRQKYDVLFGQQSANINASTNKDETAAQEVNAAKAQHEEEIASSSKIEVSHQPLNADKDEVMKDNQEINSDINIESAADCKDGNSALIGSDNKASDINPGVLNESTESVAHVSNADILENNNLIDTVEEKHEVVVEANDSHEIHEDDIKGCVSNIIYSAIGNETHSLVDSNEKTNEDSTLDISEVEKIIDNELQPNTFTEKVKDSANSEIAKSENGIVSSSLDLGGIQQKTDRSNIDNGNDEDREEVSTIDIFLKESPTSELQDSHINPDMLESLLETDTDSDIVTLITQESNNDELRDNTETNLTAPELEEVLANTQNYDKPISISQNNIYDNNGDDISTKIIEIPLTNNQDSSNMDLETAAITIQKVFRTFLFKSRASSTFGDSVNDETIFLNEDDKTKEQCDFPIAGALNERRPHGITRMDTVLQTVNEEKSLSLSTDDSSTLSSAATTIQAHVRGFLVRNKLNSNKTISTNSLATSNSNEPSFTSLEMDNEQNKNKTILNIHIVPEGGNYISRDESLITSMDLSLDSSPPSSINLHSLGYDISERRKQLKREDAIQSISPPSNNSGKLSEDVDSVKELPLNDFIAAGESEVECNNIKDDSDDGSSVEKVTTPEVKPEEKETTAVANNSDAKTTPNKSLSSDEMDVVSPFISNENSNLSDSKLMHSGEFHDAVLPTKVSRSDTSVASEFKNVLVYFILWNHS